MTERTLVERWARWIGQALLAFVVTVVALGALTSCATVQVTADREGRCRIKQEAPFEVRCWSDGKEVLIWRGSMGLQVEGVCP